MILRIKKERSVRKPGGMETVTNELSFEGLTKKDLGWIMEDLKLDSDEYEGVEIEGNAITDGASGNEPRMEKRRIGFE